MDGNTAQQIYDKAKMAVVDLFRFAKDVTQLDDPNNKIIIAKGGTKWIKASESSMFVRSFLVYFSVKIECRDDRYKISVYGFRSYNSSTTRYGVIELNAQEAEALKQGIKKDGSLRNDFYGLSWIAWLEISNNNIANFEALMPKSDANTSDDW